MKSRHQICCMVYTYSSGGSFCRAVVHVSWKWRADVRWTDSRRLRQLNDNLQNKEMPERINEIKYRCQGYLGIPQNCASPVLVTEQTFWVIHHCDLLREWFKFIKCQYIWDSTCWNVINQMPGTNHYIWRYQLHIMLSSPQYLIMKTYNYLYSTGNCSEIAKCQCVVQSLQFTDRPVLVEIGSTAGGTAMSLS